MIFLRVLMTSITGIVQNRSPLSWPSPLVRSVDPYSLWIRHPTLTTNGGLTQYREEGMVSLNGFFNRLPPVAPQLMQPAVSLFA